jgi:EAL and modified HD-GYP domain-containing signal transduction protein
MLIARQPIFKKNREVFAYELLYRDSVDKTSFSDVSSVHATASVVAGLFESGIERIVEDKFAFINFDGESFLKIDTNLIKAENVVIELLENTQITTSILEKARYLDKDNYKIALDDFENDQDYDKIMNYVTIIKFDIMKTPLSEIKPLVTKYLNQRKLLLAEKVETQEEFLQAIDMGFSLFQGYYFEKPTTIKSSRLINSSLAQYIRLFNELAKAEPSFDIMSSIISIDPVLTMRVLKIVSNFVAKKENVSNVKLALVRIGLKDLKSWIGVLLVQSFHEKTNTELIKKALLRSQFLNLITKKLKLNQINESSRLVGLFSNMDSILGCSIGSLIEQLPLSIDVTDALVYHKGHIYELLDIVKSYEIGDWDMVMKRVDELGLDAHEVGNMYLESLQYTNDILEKIDKL